MARHILMANDRWACGVKGVQLPFPSAIGEWVDPADVCKRCKARFPGLTREAMAINERIRQEWQARVDNMLKEVK